MCYERNLTPRSEMLVSQSKLKRTLTFDSVLLTKVQSISMEDFSYFFSFKEKKIRLQLISTGNSLLQTAHCFFPPKNASIDQSSVNQHARCSSNRFFFTKKKSYLQLVSTGNSLLQTWKELDTSCLDYTFHFLFFSSTSTSFERIRLHRVLRNCGSADCGTSGNSVNM